MLLKSNRVSQTNAVNDLCDGSVFSILKHPVRKPSPDDDDDLRHSILNSDLASPLFVTSFFTQPRFLWKAENFWSVYNDEDVQLFKVEIDETVKGAI